MVIDNFKVKYSEFLEKTFNRELAEYLADNGQNPKTMFITCSDSRVVPNHLINAKPGELFITRNIGNFVPPYVGDGSLYPATASALEYSVNFLKVKNIIVCGHSSCGAIGSLFQNLKPNDNNIHIVNWLKLGEDAKKKALNTLPNATLKELKDYTERESVKIQLSNLITYPYIKKKVEEGVLDIYGWFYDFRTGEIFCYDQNQDKFVPLLEYND